MKVKALRSFSGAVHMSRDQVMEISDVYILRDLLKAGYVEALEETNTKMAADTEVDSAENETEPDGNGKLLTGTLDTEELQAMHKNDLKKLAKDMGLDAEGTKDELVERIAAARVTAGVAE